MNIDNIQILSIGRIIERIEVFLYKKLAQLLATIFNSSRLAIYMVYYYLGKIKLSSIFKITVVLSIISLVLKYFSQRKKKKIIPKIKHNNLFFGKINIDKVVTVDTESNKNIIEKLNQFIVKNNKIREKLFLNKENIDDNFFRITKLYLMMARSNE
jgi:hypothetical protein